MYLDFVSDIVYGMKQFVTVVLTSLGLLACANQAAQQGPNEGGGSALAQSGSEPDDNSKQPGNSAKPVDESELTGLVLKFSGPAVGPDYFRSYTLTVTATQLKREVVGPGRDKRSEQARELDAAAFKAVLSALSQRKIEAKVETPSECDGGSTYELEQQDASGNTKKLRAYLCAGETWGDLSGDIAGFADDLNGMLPEKLPW